MCRFFFFVTPKTRRGSAPVLPTTAPRQRGHVVHARLSDPTQTKPPLFTIMHARPPLGEATNRAADDAVAAALKTPAAAGVTPGWQPRGRAASLRPAPVRGSAGATPPAHAPRADGGDGETDSAKLAARSALAKRRTRAAVVVSRVRSVGGGRAAERRRILSVSRTPPSLAVTCPSAGVPHAPAGSKQRTDACVLRRWSVEAACERGSEMRARFRRARADRKPTHASSLFQRPSSADADLSSSGGPSDCDPDDADATVCLADARRRAVAAAPKAAAAGRVRRRAAAAAPPAAAPTPRRAAVQSQVAELNSLASALLPAGTPAAAARAKDGTPLRERLARAWNGGTYYERLVAETGGGGGGGAAPAAAASKKLALTPPRGAPRVTSLAPRLPPAAKPTTAAPKPPSPGRGAPAAAAASARAAGLEAALAAERSRAVALQSELDALRGGGHAPAPPAAVLRALVVRFGRLKAEVDGALADLERVVAALE